MNRGSTFADVVGRAPDCALHRLELMSDNPRPMPTPR